MNAVKPEDPKQWADTYIYPDQNIHAIARHQRCQRHASNLSAKCHHTYMTVAYLITGKHQLFHINKHPGTAWDQGVDAMTYIPRTDHIDLQEQPGNKVSMRSPTYKEQIT